jgi:DNA repair exonuclease SbcCD ATPase subunit
MPIRDQINHLRVTGTFHRCGCGNEIALIEQFRGQDKCPLCLKKEEPSDYERLESRLSDLENEIEELKRMVRNL